MARVLFLQPNFSTSLTCNEIKYHPPSRTMGAGKCTAIVRAGMLEFGPCTCTQGIFTIAPLSTLEVTCEQCSHSLSNHQDIQTGLTEALTPAQKPVKEHKGQILCPNNYFIITANNNVRTDSY
jgi:hypothetical protein